MPGRIETPVAQIVGAVEPDEKLSSALQAAPLATASTNTCEAFPACVNTPIAAGSLPSDLSCMLGDVGYYRARADDFVKRHPGDQPPGYYLEYGEKYARLFTGETYMKLSPQGQAWSRRPSSGSSRRSSPCA